jgi:undecaprenyl-diphosphatase
MIQALIVAVLQGATELFPVSSLGHAVVLPALLGLGIDQKSHEFLPFIVFLHTGTSIALVTFFWRDWFAIATGVLGLRSAHENGEARRVFLLIVIATIPAVILGFALRKPIGVLFGTPMIAAIFLVVNGVMLLLGERLRGRGQRPITTLTKLDALVIGCFQCGALIPGISRSGATIVGGLLRGITHEGSARFSFLIATPIIVGATVLEVPKLMHEAVPPGTFTTAAIAAVVAGITAWLSTWFLMRYFHDHEDWALNPFAYYCLAFGLGSALWLGLR